MKLIAALLIAANAFGFFVGMLVYYEQMAGANPLLWIFIPDCPLYVLLASMFYLGMFQKGALRAIVAAGVLKYGLWTLFVLLYYSGYLLSDWFGWLLFVEHIGMSLQFLLIVGKTSLKDASIASGWLLLNEVADYVLGVHPYLPLSDVFAPALVALAGSVLAPLLCHLAYEKVGKNSLVRSARELAGIHD